MVMVIMSSRTTRLVKVVDAVVAAVHRVQQYFLFQGQPDAEEPGAKVNKNLKKDQTKHLYPKVFFFANLKNQDKPEKNIF